ncbi:hypothetical protein Bca101_060308 [Brassica carinata]
MNRIRKRKEPTLLEELRELELLEEGEMVDISDIEIEDPIEENTLSIIVRCLNPHAHKVGGLVKALPPIWGMEDRVRGRGVGEERVQFIFSTQSDLHQVLTRGPWFVNGWMVSMDQWSPNPAPEFLQRIPFWIRVRGLPIHMLKKQVVESLLGPLGRVELVELHAKNSNSLEYVQALVHINTEEPLQFWRIARFKSGITIPTELEYKKLIKICYTCKRFTHDQSRCPWQINGAQVEEKDKQESRKECNLRKKLQEKEHRAKEALKKNSAKGVVIRNSPVGSSHKGGKANSQISTREEKRKGKRVVSTPQLVWKQKGERGSSRLSRSTEESTANPKSSGGQCDQSSEKVGAVGIPESEPGSVFNRLGILEEDHVEEGCRGHSSSRRSGEDLRVQLSGGMREDKREEKSSKGSRSPPTVFERLGGQPNLSLREDIIGGSNASKRRRQSTSGERRSKKVRTGSSEKKDASPSVFHRLGGTTSGSGERVIGDSLSSFNYSCS